MEKIKTPHGPPLEERIDVDELLNMAERYDLLKIDRSLPYHYIAVLKPVK
jgi:hypothetical protein